MISLESQVLERHLAFFTDKTVLFAGGVNDDFPQQIQPKCQSLRVWSWYFDYAKDKNTVDFDAVFPSDADLILYYWTKNKQEVNFQLMQLLANAPIGQEMLIVGENRCGVRSAEKLLESYGEIAKIDSARRCSLYHFCLKNRPHFTRDSFWKTYKTPKLGELTIYS
ncbi:MAG TPA: 16S rRNA methyltransferase, partial [Pasteurellaceae bacterium]|nr:16S rRNA methyltransferase [Pasteurellaceae bacterium]